LYDRDIVVCGLFFVKDGFDIYAHRFCAVLWMQWQTQISKLSM
jgi:hypothetical protein